MLSVVAWRVASRKLAITVHAYALNRVRVTIQDSGIIQLEDGDFVSLFSSCLNWLRYMITSLSTKLDEIKNPDGQVRA